MNGLFDLHGRVALVTGATGGLGAATVQALADHGATLLVSDRGAAACEAVATALRHRGLTAHAAAADMADAGSIAALAERAMALCGRVDVLVCNRNLAVEWGPRGVRANAVSPGLIDTPLAAPLLGDEAFMRRRLAATPLRRVGQPHEIAGTVVFLASRAGGFVHGHNLVVDGGTTISDGS